jgi:hypothetical protein
MQIRTPFNRHFRVGLHINDRRLEPMVALANRHQGHISSLGRWRAIYRIILPLVDCR